VDVEGDLDGENVHKVALNPDAVTSMFVESAVPPFPSSPEFPRPAHRVSPVVQDTKQAVPSATAIVLAESASKSWGLRTGVVMVSCVSMLLELKPAHQARPSDFKTHLFVCG
jgi:hypothetical protein